MVNYDDTKDWADLLTAYNGQTITYDGIGNPLNYRDGITMTWQNGRGLATLTNEDEGLAVTYTYDPSGLRTKKAITGGITTKYVYEGGLLVRMSYGSNIFDFNYDANGRALGFKYTPAGSTSGAYYYYGVNSRGDIEALYNSSGTQIASYSYDAYGKPVSTNTLVSGYSTVISVQPLRYRSYVYDYETGLYYLQSRYYDPTTCRFVNADTHIISDQEIEKHNAFAYCTNNPIIKADPYGTDAIVLYDNCGQGHIGALVEGDGVWYHFFWGAPNNGQLIFKSTTSGLKDCRAMIYRGPKPDIHNRELLDEINDWGSNVYTGYDDYVYLYGDYSSCIETLSNPSEPYGLLSNNCSQFTIGTLSQVDNYNTQALNKAKWLPDPKTNFKILNNVVECDEYWYHVLTVKEARL
ncbi:MAG: RHS repeat-associated core domain-containing protein [Clostridia bacterium]|nr:RHS repeat-associated core domain-containing protein [Clostridia bacterium]